MTDETPTAANRDDHDDLPAPDRRPIPDGGLNSAMPDWMRQTPSWKREAEPAAIRTIPEADTSIIDPRSLIDVNDLPQWLQAVAARSSPAARVSPPVDHAGAVVDQPFPIAPPTDDVTAAPASTAVERSRTGPGTWLPIPAADAPAERPDHVRLTPSPLDAEPPWWMSDAVIAFLFVAIILTLIYVILAAAGVV